MVKSPLARSCEDIHQIASELVEKVKQEGTLLMVRASRLGFPGRRGIVMVAPGDSLETAAAEIREALLIGV